MDRRRFLSLPVATPLFAGCSTTSSSEDTIYGNPIPPSRDDLETAPRPPADEPSNATKDTVSPRQYPTKPAAYDDEHVKRFVESHERAYRRNALLDRFGSNLVSYDAFWDWTVTLAANGDAGVGRCQYRYSDTVDEGDGTHAIGDSPSIVVTYYVDDSMIVRAEDTGHVERRDELTPDPWETGVILEPSE